MTSSSKLGEPLNAEIELLSVAPSELSSIQAALASEQFYQDQLLEKPNSYPFIKIEVASNPQGQPILKLSSTQPITEAFLDMLIQVDWPTGRLVKEYTLLLDPPGFNSSYVAEPAILPGIDKPVLKATPTSPTPSKAVQATAEKPTKPAAETVQASAESASAAIESIKVKKGDNLHQLAEQLRPDNVTQVQMLAAMYQANQSAFDGQNMNRLKVGKILRIPSSSDLAALDQAQAQRIVNTHLAEWQAYKNGLANAVQRAPASAQSASAQTSTGKIVTAEKVTPSAARPSKDVLKLSAGDEKSSQTTSAAKKGLEDKVNSLQEELIAKENAIKEEKSRTGELEKQIEDMKKLLALKNEAMAKVQENASKSVSVEPAASDAQATADPAMSAKSEAPVVTPLVDAASAVNSLETPVVPAPSVASTPAPSSAEVTQPEITAPAPSEFSSFLKQRLKQTHPSLLVGLIVLPLLGCLWLWTRIRRKKQIHTFEEAIMTSPATEMQSNTVFGHTQATSGDTSFLTDFSQSAVGGMIDAHEVDPIAEAEVYMAYGRDAQAEEILKDAIQKDPRRQELKVKLLEIYQATDNAAAFDTLANTLYTQTDPKAEVWAQVAALGRQMDPNNPLYRVEEPSDNLAVETGSLDDNQFASALSTDDNTQASALSLDDETQPVPETIGENGLQPKPITLPELDFEDESLTPPSTLEDAAMTSGELNLADTDTMFDQLPELSFELDSPTTRSTANENAVPQVEPVAVKSADDTLESTDTEETLAMEASPTTESMTLTHDVLPSSESITLASDAFENQSIEPEAITLTVDETGSEEVDTKLDLIKAYIDMEDLIGAKELIEEVMQEGSQDQKQQAKELLQKIA